jgi:hypothetical protein
MTNDLQCWPFPVDLNCAPCRQIDAGGLRFPALRNATRQYSAWRRFALVACFDLASNLFRSPFREA